MFASERHDLIVEMITKSGRVTVKELALRFDISEDSIRKDLTLLEHKGLLKKTYGGAVALKENPHLFALEQRKEIASPQRLIIARKAAELIRPDETVFLDISATNIELAREISQLDFNLTVVTNMIDVLNSLIQARNIEVIFIGGKINQERDGFWDSVALKMIRLFKIDRAFLGVVGIDLIQDQLTTYHIEDGNFKEQIIASSQASYLLCEQRKFSEYGNYIFGALEDVSALIISDELLDEQNEIIKEKGITTI